jgi:hypothetical protein
LKELQNAVKRAVHGKYPSIEISDKKKKKANMVVLLESLGIETCK